MAERPRDPDHGPGSLDDNRAGDHGDDLYFACGFVVANGWLVQNPSINGYSGAFGYDLASGVTIVVGATKSEKAPDGTAFNILREVTKDVTPAKPINF